MPSQLRIFLLSTQNWGRNAFAKSNITEAYKGIVLHHSRNSPLTHLIFNLNASKVCRVGPKVVIKPMSCCQCV